MADIPQIFHCLNPSPRRRLSSWAENPRRRAKSCAEEEEDLPEHMVLEHSRLEDDLHHHMAREHGRALEDRGEGGAVGGGS